MTDRRSGAGRGKENSRRKTRRGNRDSRTGTDGKARGREPGSTGIPVGRRRNRAGKKGAPGENRTGVRAPGCCGGEAGRVGGTARDRVYSGESPAVRAGTLRQCVRRQASCTAPEAERHANARADSGGKESGVRSRQGGSGWRKMSRLRLRSRGIPASCSGWEGKHEAARAARQTERAGERGNRTDGTTGTTGTTGEKPGGQGNRLERKPGKDRKRGRAWSSK